MTARIMPIDPAQAQGSTKEMFGAIKAKFGMVPNTLKTMGQSPAALEAYLGISGAIAKGVLPAIIREQIYLYVSQKNGCDYCLSAHTLSAKHAGLKPEQILAARKGISEDPKGQAILTLVKGILERNGNVADEELAAARDAGLTDAELVEVVGNITSITFTNYLNQLAHVDIDFPKVSASL